MGRDRSRHERIREVFQAALDKPAGERAAFLRQACAGDADLHRDVASLLEAHAAAGPFLEQPAVDALESSAGGPLLGSESSVERGAAYLFAPGARVGPYEMLAPLGTGGMGVVFRARDTRLAREVAIKVLPESFAHDPDRRARFEREARVLASLNHPHIAAVYGLEQAEGHTCLVMELVDGPTLAGRLAQAGSRRTMQGSRRGRGAGLPLAEALSIARQIAEALQAAHENGIVHRDLKPANVGFTAEGHVKVLDFGLAKPLMEEPQGDGADSAFSFAATAEGVILGTAAYMAPEQARGRAVDKRADIWAFGVVLYEMVTGSRPFRGDDVSETLAAVIKEEPRWDEVPANVRWLLQSCLAKDPQTRLRDIGDVWRLVDTQPAQVTPPRSMTTRTSHWLGWAGFGVAAVAGLALAVVHVRESPQPLPRSIRFQFTPPDKVTVHDVGGFAVSPDGRQVAFTATGPDNVARLWVRTLESLDARPQAGTDDAAVLVARQPVRGRESRGKTQKV